MMNFNVWTKAAFRFHLSVIRNTIVKMERMKRIATFLYLIVPKESSNVRECWGEWVVPEEDAFFNDSDAMEVIITIINIFKKIISSHKYR
jgi:hypothetical protein